MPDLDFPDLARPAAESTSPPAFETILGRAHRRRRQQGLARAAAAIAVVLAVALGVHLAQQPDAAPQPAHRVHPRPAPALTHLTASQIVARGRLVGFGENPSGDLLTAWSVCPSGAVTGCQVAWRLARAEGASEHVLPSDEQPEVATSTDGDFVLLWSDGALVVRTDGSGLPVRLDMRAATPPRAGDVVTEDVQSTIVLVDPRTASGRYVGHLPGQDYAGDPVVGSDDTIWGTVETPHHGADLVVRTTDGVHWSTRAMPGTVDSFAAGVVTAGSRVAALSTGDGTDVPTVEDLAVSTDGGRTWTDRTFHHLPIQNITALATTSDGRLLISDEQGRVLRSTDATWTHFSQIATLPSCYSMEGVGDHVIAQIGDGPHLVEISRSGTVTTIRSR